MGKLAAFYLEYVKANLKIQMEYKLSFLGQVVGMMINDFMWIVFWMLFFHRFPSVKGWTLDDVIVLWAVMATSFGVVYGFFSNVVRLNALAVEGQLDYYLTLPKPVLFHLAIARFAPHNLGDVIFGPAMLILFVDMDPVRWAVYLVAVLLASTVIFGFTVLLGSLVFYLGNAERVGYQLTMALFHFTAYPTHIFPGGIKLLLFTLIPAGFVAQLPVELVRSFTWPTFLALAGGALTFLLLGTASFYRGLKRYESGNLTMMRS